MGLRLTGCKLIAGAGGNLCRCYFLYHQRTGADIDGDGDMDILVPSIFSNTVGVKLNNGTGVFSNGATVAVGSEPYRVAISDIDGDGDLNLLASNFAGNTVSVRLNGGTGVLATTNTHAATQTELMLCPNPARATLMVSVLKSPSRAPVMADVFNSLGQRVLAGIPLTPTATVLDVSGLAKGIYVIRAQTATGPLAERMVIE